MSPTPHDEYYTGAPRPPQPPPRSRMPWAIVATVIGFIPFGIVGIVQASLVSVLWSAGDQERAVLAARRATVWSVAAVVTAAVLWLVLGSTGALDWIREQLADG